MDPEILQLLTAARQTTNNKNMAGVLGNLDNPLLAFLAGIPAQRSAQTDMPLTEAYSNSADPVVQQILNQVNTGIDQYALSSWLASQEANPEFSSAMADAGWQPEDLEGLAVGLQKERAKGGKAAGSSWWAKAGLSDPSATYDEMNVPLDDESAMDIADIRMRKDEMMRRLNAARERLKMSELQAGPGYGKDWSNKDMVNYLTTTSSGQKMAKAAGIDLSKVDPTTGEIFRFGTSKQKRRPWWRPDRMIADGIVRESSRLLEDFIDLQRGSGNKNIKDVIPGLSPSPEALRRVEAAKRAAIRLEDEAGFLDAEEQAIRRGRARAFAEAGRTPAADQVKTMLSFLSGK